MNVFFSWHFYCECQLHCVIVALFWQAILQPNLMPIVRFQSCNTISSKMVEQTYISCTSVLVCCTCQTSYLFTTMSSCWMNFMIPGPFFSVARITSHWEEVTVCIYSNNCMQISMSTATAAKNGNFSNFYWFIHVLYGAVATSHSMQ